MANFWVIYERQENQASWTRGNPSEGEPPGRSVASTKVAAQRPREAETKARWSGQPELAKIVLVEAGSAAEARQNVQALFPGSTAQATVSIEENKFLEPAS